MKCACVVDRLKLVKLKSIYFWHFSSTSTAITLR